MRERGRERRITDILLFFDWYFTGGIKGHWWRWEWLTPLEKLADSGINSLPQIYQLPLTKNLRATAT